MRIEPLICLDLTLQPLLLQFKGINLHRGLFADVLLLTLDLIRFPLKFCDFVVDCCLSLVTLVLSLVKSLLVLPQLFGQNPNARMIEL